MTYLMALLHPLVDGLRIKIVLSKGITCNLKASLLLLKVICHKLEIYSLPTKACGCFFSSLLIFLACLSNLSKEDRVALANL